jgi:outer membrane protein assembly factor BamB
MVYQPKKGKVFWRSKNRAPDTLFLIAIAFLVQLMLRVGARAVEIAWEADVHAAAAPPVYESGAVIVASADKHLRAFDAESGDKLWDARFKTPLTFPPAAAGGKVYITVLHPLNKLICFDAADGKKLWSADLDDHATAPAAVNAGVVVGSGDFTVLYDPDGTLINKVKTDDYVDAVYGLSEGILVVYVTGEIALYDGGLVNVVARADLGGGCSYPLFTDRGVLFARYDGEAVMADDNLNVVWRAVLPERIMSPPVAYGDGYVVSYLGGGVAYVSENGVVEKYTPLGFNVYGSPVIADGDVYVLTEKGVIYVLGSDGVAEEFDALKFKTSGGLFLFDGKLWAADGEGRARVYFVNED